MSLVYPRFFRVYLYYSSVKCPREPQNKSTFSMQPVTPTAAMPSSTSSSASSHSSQRSLQVSVLIVGRTILWSYECPILQDVPCAHRLGFVDFVYQCSNVFPTLLGLMGIWQKQLGSWATWWNTEIKTNPTQGHKLMGRPVDV